MKTDDEFCKVITDYGKIGSKKNRTGEMCDVKLCTVSWHGKYQTYDIRMWKPNGDADKGISLNAEQVKNLRELLNSIEI